MTSARRHCADMRRAQAGVGLIEVLISVLVLSFGMLGLAGLQLWSLRSNQSAMERSLAVVQTHSIVDAMRADRATAIAGGFDVAPGEESSEGATFALSALANWRASLVDTLGPDATGGISCDDNLCTITVRWNDQRAAAAEVSDAEQDAGTELEVTTQVRL